MAGFMRIGITPNDMYERLSDEAKEKYNKLFFTDVRRESDMSITIDCILVNDVTYETEKMRQHLLSKDYNSF